MAPIIPDGVPKSFAAGTTVKFARNFPDYPSSQGWAHTIYFNGPTNVFNVSGVAQPDGSFLVTITPATTASIAAGIYHFAERLTNTGTGEVIDVEGDGNTVEIEQNLATAAAGAFVSHAERSLAIIEAAIEGRLSADLQNYTIAGRAVTKIPIQELRQLRGIYAAEVARIKNPGTLGTPTWKIGFGVEQESNPQLPPTWVDVMGLE